MKIMCSYYKKLSAIDGSGIIPEDAEKIFDEMPLMQNGRDYNVTFLYESGEKHSLACKNAVSELVWMFGNVAKNMCRGQDDTALRIKAAEAATAFADTVFTDGDFA